MHSAMPVLSSSQPHSTNFLDKCSNTVLIVINAYVLRYSICVIQVQLGFGAVEETRVQQQRQKISAIEELLK